MYHTLLNSPVGAETQMLLPTVETMVGVLYFGLFAISFDFISGYTGYLSFGHAVFYGTGAYTVILIANGRVPLLGPGTPFMLSLVVGGLIAVVLAILVGLVSFRLSGVYFAMITLGFAQVLYVFVRGWDYVATNPRDGPAVGPSHAEGFQIGVPGIDQLSLSIGVLTGDEVALLGSTLSGTEVSYYMIGLVVLVCYFAMQRVIHSPFGRVLIAIRENEERAVAVGYNTYLYKLGAFAISGFFAAIAGGIFAAYSRSVAPDGTFYFLVTADALITTIVGGFGTLAGPVYGTLFNQGLEDVLSTESGGIATLLREGLPASVLEADLFGVSLELFVNTAVDGRAPLYLGIVFVLFVLFVPNGILGTLRDRLGGTVGKRLPDYLRRYRK